MEGKQVVYQGRAIATDGFRTFIYSTDGFKKLVNSWDEYEAHIAMGIWFSSIDEANEFNKKMDEEKTESHKKRSK